MLHGRRSSTGRGAPQATRQPVNQYSVAWLIRVLERAEVEHDKVFLFSQQTKSPVLKKDRCPCRGEIGMKIETEITQACLQKETWYSLVPHYINKYILHMYIL